MLRRSFREVKRVVVLVVGGAIALLGVALLVLPGPGLLVIFLGLSLLASEFEWARAWLRRLKTSTKRAARRARDWNRRRRERRRAQGQDPTGRA